MAALGIGSKRRPRLSCPSVSQGGAVSLSSRHREVLREGVTSEEELGGSEGGAAAETLTQPEGLSQ